MYIDRSRNREEYPYKGEFYIKGSEVAPDNGDLFGETSEVGEQVVLETECDVLETNRAFSAGSITASFDVYLPMPDVVEIERGMMFRCNTFGLEISGVVVSVGASKLGGLHAYIKSSEI